MAEFENADDDIDDIMNAADALLGETLAGLTFNPEAVDTNPYKRSKKAPKAKNYNKPDPSFDFLLNMNAASPINPNKGPKAKKKRFSKPSSAKMTSKRQTQSRNSQKSSAKPRKTGSPYGQSNILKKMSSPKSRKASKRIKQAASPNNKYFTNNFRNSNYSKTVEVSNPSKIKVQPQ
jgi:hypothetical protein